MAEIVTTDGTTKNTLLSKTLWINLAVAAMAIFYPPAGDWMTANAEIVVSIVAGVNILLRLVSKDKLVLW